MVLWFCLGVAESVFQRIEPDMSADLLMFSETNRNATCWLYFIMICLCQSCHFVHKQCTNDWLAEFVLLFFCICIHSIYAESDYGIFTLFDQGIVNNLRN